MGERHRCEFVSVPTGPCPRVDTSPEETPWGTVEWLCPEHREQTERSTDR